MWSEDIEKEGVALFSQHYSELVVIARAIRQRYGSSNTLLTGDLLHEAYLKLSAEQTFTDERHFKAVVAVAMRHVAIDRARKRLAEKHGGGLHRADDTQAFDEAALVSYREAERTININQLIEELEAENPRQARVFSCRYYAGYTAAETAEIFAVTEKTIQRDWKTAREWLKSRLVDQAGIA